MTETKLYFLRFSLLFFPAAISLFIGNYENPKLYTFQVLLLLAIAALYRYIKPHSFAILYLSIEMVYSAILFHAYGGLLYFCMVASLFVYGLKRSEISRPLFLFHIAIVNVAALDQPLPVVLTANFLFLLSFVLIRKLSIVSQIKKETDSLYDELRRKHYELDEARRQLVDYAKMVEKTAQAEERTRISRALHDDLGHQLIRLKMMMEAALTMFDRDSEQSKSLFIEVKNQLTDSMEKMRATVRKLKPAAEPDRIYSLTSLLQQLGSNESIAVQIETNGLPYPLYPSLEVILYQNAKEAVTNAIRHGEASTVKVKLIYGSKEIRMQVSNDGKEASLPVRQGIGLSGMKERTKLVGGDVQICSGSPFTIETILPTFRQRELEWE